MNTGMFAGRLGRDAELRSTDRSQVLNFSLAVDTGFGDNKKTLWVDCALWGERAPKLEQYLLKGKQVTVCGDVDLRTFEKRDGSQGVSMTCNVQRLTLQGGKEGGSGERAEPREQRREAPAESGVAAGSQPDFDDAIPFAWLVAVPLAGLMVATSAVQWIA